jgi:beta-ureidopropionase
MEKKNEPDRRGFIKKASIAAGLGLVGAPALNFASVNNPKAVEKRNRLPREVWVASQTIDGIEAQSLSPEERIEMVFGRMDEVLPYEPDIICLTELFLYTGARKNVPPLSERAEIPPGPITGRFAEYARKHRCNIICPINTKEDGKYYNAAVVIDRSGGIVGEYRKIRPTVGEMKGGISPGPRKPPVFKLDFGTIGIQICYDLNWHDQWRDLKESGAEIVFWASQYNGGRLLNAEAWMNKYHVVSSTRRNPSLIIDISGEELYSSEKHESWVCGPVNLEKEVVARWPYVTKLNQVRAKYGRKLSITIFPNDARMIFESLSPDLRVADVLKEFDIHPMEMRIKNAERMHEKYWQGE